MIPNPLLRENGIQTLVHYPVPPHKQKAYENMNNLPFPISEEIHREVLSLPISQIINRNDVNKITNQINDYLC